MGLWTDADLLDSMSSTVKDDGPNSGNQPVPLTGGLSQKREQFLVAF